MLLYRFTHSFKHSITINPKTHFPLSPSSLPNALPSDLSPPMSLTQMLPTNIQHLCKATIFLSLLFLFVHGYPNFIISGNSEHLISSDSKEHHGLMVHRKVLSTKFNFTPFLHHMPEPDPSGKEVDPLYGEEKRRVPSGPNPLHHWGSSPSLHIFVTIFIISYPFSTFLLFSFLSIQPKWYQNNSRETIYWIPKRSAYWFEIVASYSPGYAYHIYASIILLVKLIRLMNTSIFFSWGHSSTFSLPFDSLSVDP